LLDFTVDTPGASSGAKQQVHLFFNAFLSIPPFDIMGRMRLLDLTLPAPAENLALDEALLEEAETAAKPLETLRFWEPAQNVAVVGRSSRVETEVHTDACRELGIPVLRRISGGTAIVAGPGCLMYSLVLGYQNRPGLRAINQAHAFMLGTLARALNSLPPSPFGRGAGGEGNAACDPTPLTPILSRLLVPDVRCCGTSDLILETGLEALKFSGNSMRCRKRHFLYHGTILYNFPLDMISRCLKIPPRMPDYRDGRDHRAFVTNLPLSGECIRRALISAWNALELREDWPRELTARLVAEKYGNSQWNQ
jgi:lipoate-protein ligase A